MNEHHYALIAIRRERRIDHDREHNHESNYADTKVYAELTEAELTKHLADILAANVGVENIYKYSVLMDGRVVSTPTLKNQISRSSEDDYLHIYQGDAALLRDEDDDWIEPPRLDHIHAEAFSRTAAILAAQLAEKERVMQKEQEMARKRDAEYHRKQELEMLARLKEKYEPR